MAIKIWRKSEHADKQGINIEQFVDNVQKDLGDVYNVKSLATVSLNMPAKTDFDKTKERVSVAIVVAVMYTPFSGT